MTSKISRCVDFFFLPCCSYTWYRLPHASKINCNSTAMSITWPWTWHDYCVNYQQCLLVPLVILMFLNWAAWGRRTQLPPPEWVLRELHANRVQPFTEGCTRHNGDIITSLPSLQGPHLPGLSVMLIITMERDQKRGIAAQNAILIGFSSLSSH